MGWLNTLRVFIILRVRWALLRKDPMYYRLTKWKLRKPDCSNPTALRLHLQDGKPVTPQLLGAGGANDKQLELLTPIAQAMNALFYERRSPDAELLKAHEVLQQNKDSYLFSWLQQVETLCLSGGLFSFAYSIRKLTGDDSIQKYAGRRRVSSHDAAQLLWAYLANGMDDEAMAVCGRMNAFARFMLHKMFDQLLFILGLNDTFPIQRTLAQQDQDYLKRVQGKRIAILGPSAGKLDAAEVREHSDLVMRMNFRGESTLEESRKGIKTNIAYYNTLAARRIRQDHLGIDYLDELDYAVFKTDYEAFEKDMIAAGRARVVSVPYKLMFCDASPNLLQVMLFDLKHFSPSRIKVYNVNLFLASNRYQAGYKIPGTIQDKISFWRSFGMHNMMSMFLFTQIMYRHGVFEADEECNDVLSMPLSDYVAGMQALEWSDLLTGPQSGEQRKEQA